MKSTVLWMSALAGAAFLATADAWGQTPGPAQRRLALITAASRQADAAIPLLRKGLADTNVVVRRTAARLLADMGPPARDALLEAFGNDDPVVRQAALKGLLTGEEQDRQDVLTKALADPDLPLRLLAVNALVAVSPPTEPAMGLLRIAAKDEDDAVRSIAARAMWPFHRDVIPLRERADWDHEVELVTAIDLPKEDWRFSLDPKRDGHLARWYEPAFDDSAWKTIAIEQTWQKAGYDYIGVAWYRRWIELPPKPAGTVNAVEIALDGVDECAWIWLNGAYVGGHDIGPMGWDKPFTLDITDAVKWGERNHITVRAMNTAHAGGVWRPVRIEVLK